MTAPAMELRRVAQPAPTEEGWFFARPNESANNPFPVRVRMSPMSSKLVVSVDNNAWLLPLHEYEWFGPVPACIASVCSAG